jgi:hypothetical protein
MIKELITQFFKSPIGKLSNELNTKLEKFIEKQKQDNTWNRVVKDVISATEGFDDEIGKYVFTRLSILNLRERLFDENEQNIYKDFVLTLAMELTKFDKEKDFAIPVGLTIVDNCYKSKNIPVNNESYNTQELLDIITNREKLYRHYFKLFEDKNGVDKIRIFYPKNGENWIRYSEEYSVIINVNLSKGILYGFCRKGFDYYKINNNSKKTLKCAYIENQREILRFESTPSDKESVIIWLR